MIEAQVHLPWIGEHYKQGIAGRRIAICGYSHTDADTAEATQEVVQKLIDGAYEKIAFFNQIIQYFGFYSHKDFWPQVIFFNFVPTSIGSRDHKYDSATDDQKSLGRTRFLQILEGHKPNEVFVFTTKGWESLPHSVEDDLGKPGMEPSGWHTYAFDNGHVVRATGLRHPQGATKAEMIATVSAILALPVLPPNTSRSS